MRIIFFIIVFHLSCQTFAQNEKIPSNAEIKAQMKQTLTDARKQREEVKQQLAEAKANNEDAATIKQLEDQYKMLDNMINQLQTMDPTQNLQKKRLPVSKTVEPAFVSPFTPIMLKGPVATPAASQAKDELLWFRGKKIDANTLITADGTVVKYNPGKHSVTVQTDKNKDTTYYALVAALSRMSRGKGEFISAVDTDPNSFFFFPVINAAYNEFDGIKNRFYDVAKNTEDITPPPIYSGLQAIQQRLIDFMATLSPNPPAPLLPKRPGLFCSCDFDNQLQVYETQMNDWKDEFMKDELQLSKLIKWIYSDINSLIARGIRGTEPANLQETIESARILLLKRLNSKLKFLKQQYLAKNIDVEGALTFAMHVLNVSIENYNSIAGPDLAAEIRSGRQEIASAKNLIFSSLFKNVIEEKKAIRDFATVLNYPIYTEHETNKEMLDENYRRNINPWLKIMHDFNFFSLSFKMNFEYQVVDKHTEPEDLLMIATGSLQSAPMTVSLSVEDCKVLFYIESVNNKNLHTTGEEFKIPMNVTGGTKDYTKDQYAAFAYTGPSTMRLLFPVFNLNFCGNKSEVRMEGLTYLPSDLKAHEHDDVARKYTTDMFAYANKMLTEIKKTQVNAGQLIQSSIQGLGLTSNSSMSQSTGNPVLDEMKENYEMDKKRRDLLYQIGQAGQTQKANVNLGVINAAGSPTLINMQVDLADPTDSDRDRGIVLQHGYLTIELIHTPK